MSQNQGDARGGRMKPDNWLNSLAFKRLAQPRAPAIKRLPRSDPGGMNAS
jgi:hypothetical protein